MIGLMRLKTKMIFQKYDKSKVISQHAQKVQANNIFKNKVNSSKLTKSQELKSHFKIYFVQEKIYVPTKIFYNYYCKINHILLDCGFRKKNNKSGA
jgi:hypothetical protein